MKKTLLISLLLTLLADAYKFGPALLPSHAAARLVPTGNNVALAAVAPATVITFPQATPPPPPAAARLAAAKLNPAFAELYLATQARTGTPWQLIAAVHVVETHQAGDTARTSSAGATGPFQFMPATWRVYALDGDGDGQARITDVDDAAFTAGRYLATGGATTGNYRGALYHYNHSWTYVSNVMAIAGRLGL